MKFKEGLLVFVAMLFFWACDNEIDLTGKHIETPVVMGLMNANVDTQFVRINKTFLEEGANPTELAKDPNQLIYDSLDAYIINSATNHRNRLKRILRKKESGLFSDDKNVLYYTTSPLTVGEKYELLIETPGGLRAKAETKIIDTVRINRPELIIQKQDLTFKNLNNKFIDFDFEFTYPAEIARFDIKLFLQYVEVTSQGRKKKSVEVPVSTVDNAELVKGDEVSLSYYGKRFYKAIAKAVPKDGIRREVALKNSIKIAIYAADSDFRFYNRLNGPIDGLSQVRPEYSNVENGIGLFASRAYSIAYTQLSQMSRQELLSGPITAGRGFVNP